MTDGLLVLQSSTTQTANYNGAGVSLRLPSDTSHVNEGGTPKWGLFGLVFATTVTGTGTFSFKIQHSDDNSTWNDLAFNLNGPLSSAREDAIHFVTDKPWVRLVFLVDSGAPTVTYNAALSLSSLSR